jgi:hypothetical protein
MRYGYAWEKLYNAVRALLLGEGPIKERLGKAFLLHLSGLRLDQLPETKREEFQEICREITSAETVGDVGKIAASVAAMSEERASAIAEKVFEIFVDISRAEVGCEERTSGHDPQVIPPVPANFAYRSLRAAGGGVGSVVKAARKTWRFCGGSGMRSLWRAPTAGKS